MELFLKEFDFPGGFRGDSGIASEAVEPDHFRVAAEPRPLAFGVAPRHHGGLFDRLFAAHLSSQIAEGLRIAERFEGFGGRGAATGEESADFLDESGGEHLFNAGFDARVEGVARRIEPQAENAIALQRITLPGGVEFRKRTAGGENDFKRADQLIGVVGVDARRRGAIEAAEDAVQGAGAAGFTGVETVTKLFVAFGTFEKSVDEGADVEAGASGEDGEMVAGGDIGQCGARMAGKITGGEIAGGIGDIDQPMGGSGAFLR